MVDFSQFLNTIDFVQFSIGFGQRVLNDLKKARLSRGSVIWLLDPPPPNHFRVSYSSSIGDTQEEGKSPQESLAIYRLFNTLWDLGRWMVAISSNRLGHLLGPY
jgi:hypothetical protein